MLKTELENGKRMQNLRYLVAWVGGKRLLRKTIVPMIPDDIQLYCEPFGGGGWILFGKDKWAEVEVYNDLDSNLVNLFRIVKYHHEALIHELRYILNSRQMFEDALIQKPVTDVQKAAMFFILLTRSFGGKMKTYGTGKTSRGNGSAFMNVIPRIEAIAERLDKVNVENRDFEKIFASYDHSGAFFYCDPPYSTGTGYDVTSCENFDHKRLFNCLKQLKGRWLLSYDDCDMIRKMYSKYEIIPVSRQKGINNYSVKNREYKEVLIRNY